MNPIDFLNLVAEKKGMDCIIETNEEVYEGVYLCQGTERKLQMVIRPTGKTKETLKYVAIPETPEIDLPRNAQSGCPQSPGLNSSHERDCRTNKKRCINIMVHSLFPD